MKSNATKSIWPSLTDFDEVWNWSLWRVFPDCAISTNSFIHCTVSLTLYLLGGGTNPNYSETRMLVKTTSLASSRVNDKVSDVWVCGFSQLHQLSSPWAAWRVAQIWDGQSSEKYIRYGETAVFNTKLTRDFERSVLGGKTRRLKTLKFSTFATLSTSLHTPWWAQVKAHKTRYIQEQNNWYHRCI